MGKKKEAGAQRELQVAVESDFGRMLGPMFAQMRRAAVEEAKAEMRAEMRGKPAPEPEPPPEPRVVPGPQRKPGSRYGEPGVRVRKLGRIEAGTSGEKTKIWSAFMDPEIIAAFREEARHAGMTQRYAAEEAFSDWVKKKSGGKRVLRPERTLR
jgi:hypothetical protein